MALLEVLDVHLEHMHPGLVSKHGKVLPDEAQVKDDDNLLGHRYVHIETAHVVHQALSGLLQGDVESLNVRLHGVVEQDVERQRRLHCARLSRQQDNRTLGDASPQLLIETLDVGLDQWSSHMPILPKWSGIFRFGLYISFREAIHSPPGPLS